VEEWLINERGSGRATAGGSWNDAWYLFTDGGARPELGAWDTVGFRCVSRPAAAAADQGSARIEPRRDIAPLPSAADDATYRGFLSHYRYDRTPLEVEVLETVDGPDWSREKLAFPGVEVEPILAYLYLPKRGRQPFQTLYWMVSGTVTLGGRTAAKEVEAILAPQIKGGRAVMAVVPKYGTERRDPPPPPPGERPPVWSRNRAIGKVTEYRIGLDYLETREEIDLRRVAHVGFSSGATRTALIFAALEPRIRSFVFIGGGLYETGRLPEVNAINFVPRIDRPVLVLSGWYDEVLHVEPLVRDLFERLPGPKRLELVESGHLPPLEIRNPIITRFLDETLGPVGSGRLPSGDEVADALSTPD